MCIDKVSLHLLPILRRRYMSREDLYRSSTVKPIALLGMPGSLSM
jgi:hypothetical protein